jgi:hypothetical protein
MTHADRWIFMTKPLPGGEAYWFTKKAPELTRPGLELSALAIAGVTRGSADNHFNLTDSWTG